MLKLIKFKLFFCFFIYAGSVFAGGINQYKFIENKGQLPANVFYAANVESGNIYFEKHCLTFDFLDAEEAMHPHKKEVLSKTNTAAQNKTIKRHTYKMFFEGVNASATIQSQLAIETKYSYFYGKDESKWVSGAKAYHKIIYRDIYKNISATYYTSAKNTFKYDFVLSPGAKHNDIKLKYEGVNSIKIVNGNIEIITSLNQVTEQKPYAYQVIDRRKIAVPCNYVLTGNTVSFDLPYGYNKNLPLIIDPEIIFSTYSGSAADNFGMCATYDKAGNAYGGGLVFSAGFPVNIGAYQSVFGGGLTDLLTDEVAVDVGILKFSNDGKKLLFATYLGGKANEQPHSMIVNKKEELVVLGSTASSNFPVTTDGLDTSYNGKYDIFICKLSADGSKLITSTFYGGTLNDGVNQNDSTREIELDYNYGDKHRSEVQLDGKDNIVFVSNTRSSNFPVINAFQNSLSGTQDACIVKFNPTLNAVIFSTYFGGDSLEAAYGLTINTSNDIYLCGGTSSSDFPVTKKAYQQVYNKMIDGFVAHFSTGGKLLHSTYLGTDKYDQAFLIKHSINNRIYIIGQTLGDFPVSEKVYFSYNSGQFIAILDDSLSILDKSTIFGHGYKYINIVPTAFHVDSCENIYFAGWGGSVNQAHNDKVASTYKLPFGYPYLRKTTDGSDFYLGVFTKNLIAFRTGSFWGGSQSQDHSEGGQSRFDDKNNLYLAMCGGCGGFSDMPTSDSAWSRRNNGMRPDSSGRGCNQAISKIDFSGLFGKKIYFEVYPGAERFVYTSHMSDYAINYLIDWGDGTIEKYDFMGGRHIYDEDGVYTICLIAERSCGNDTVCKEATVFYSGINDEESNSRMVLYPNPSSGKAHLLVKDQSLVKHFPANIYMTDVLGRTVLSSKISTELSEIDVQGLKSGIYFYRITSGEKVLATGKLNVTK